jgi:hypothetical protein
VFRRRDTSRHPELKRRAAIGAAAKVFPALQRPNTFTIDDAVAKMSDAAVARDTNGS